MATEHADPDTVYEVYCRGCDWQADDAVDLKGEANLIAGRHISETGHVVVVKTISVEPSEAGDDFRRGGRREVTFERLSPVGDEVPPSAMVRACGPVDCVVE